MGGLALGERASEEIVLALADLSASGNLSADIASVTEAIGNVHHRLHAIGADHGAGSIVASTVVVFLGLGRSGACLWAGDSRLYRKRAGQLVRMTRDHSEVQELIDKGRLAEADAESHPLAHYVTRGVGLPGRLHLDRREFAIEPDDWFLLCSDGLTNMLSDREIAARLDGQPEAAVANLIQAALAAGGIDNVTAVAIRCPTNLP
jgi:serine/threonine protein phosphatase PrpC